MVQPTEMLYKGGMKILQSNQGGRVVRGYNKIRNHLINAQFTFNGQKCNVPPSTGNNDQTRQERVKNCELRIPLRVQGVGGGGKGERKEKKKKKRKGEKRREKERNETKRKEK